MNVPSRVSVFGGRGKTISYTEWVCIRCTGLALLIRPASGSISLSASVALLCPNGCGKWNKSITIFTADLPVQRWLQRMITSLHIDSTFFVFFFIFRNSPSYCQSQQSFDRPSCLLHVPSCNLNSFTIIAEACSIYRGNSKCPCVDDRV